MTTFSDLQILNALVRVSRRAGHLWPSQQEYRTLRDPATDPTVGTIVRRMNGWLAALERAGLADPTQAPTPPPVDLTEPVARPTNPWRWFSHEWDDAVAERMGRPLTEAQVRRMAANAITVAFWRNTVIEDMHSRGLFSEEMMFLFNAATSRLVDDLLQKGTAPVDVVAILGDRDRPVLPLDVSLGELFGARLAKLHAEQAASLVLWPEGLPLGAWVLDLGNPVDWWGTPWWPEVVALFSEWLDDPSRRPEYIRSIPEPPGDYHEALPVLQRAPDYLGVEWAGWFLECGLQAAVLPGRERWRAAGPA